LQSTGEDGTTRPGVHMYHYMAMEKVGMVKMQILMNKDIYVREEVELIPVLLQV
jgi:hypothetical protein